MGIAAPVRAQEYIIGIDDVLQISVWMRPELERTVTVGAQGTIVLPPIGEIKAAGLSPKQLADQLSDRLSSYLRQTTSVTVAVTQFMSRSINVTGAVARPGRYGFEKIPGMLDVLAQAGGGTPGADLSRVQILRREGTALQTLTANVYDALDRGTSEGLPELKPGDVVVVPGSQDGASGPITPDAVGIMGEVGRAGYYTVGDGMDIWMALALAGGPTERADMSRIRVLRRDAKEGAVVEVDLAQTLRHGNVSPFLVKPGDVVYIKPRGQTWLGFLAFLAFARDVLGIAILIAAVNSP
jgi:polysaccharide export outer membrane protein